MSKPISTYRACSVCGQQKPLMAFLQLTEQGHTFGDICATCRGAGLTRKKSPELEAVEKAGGTTGHQVDSKKRLQEEREKRQHEKLGTELDHEEKIKKDATASDTAEKKQQDHDAQRRHREEYIQKQDTPAKKQTDKREIPSGTTQQIQRFYQDKSTINTEANKQAKSQEFGVKTELGPDEIQKYVSASGRSAESLFGSKLGSFMRTQIKNRNLGSTLDKFQQKTDAKPGLHSNTAVTTEQKQAPKVEAENLAQEFVKSNFKK